MSALAMDSRPRIAQTLDQRVVGAVQPPETRRCSSGGTPPPWSVTAT